MYIESNSIDPEYRKRLLEAVSRLVALESGADIPVDELMLSIVFLQAHLGMLLETVVTEETRAQDK